MDSTIDLQFVEYIVKSLVGNPDAVSIKRTIDEKGVLLELTVDPEDLGRVIGKRGATAQSLRTLLRALGTKNDARYNLKIVDNGAPRPPREDREDRPEQNDRSDRYERPVRDDANVSQDNTPVTANDAAVSDEAQTNDTSAETGQNETDTSYDAWSTGAPKVDHTSEKDDEDHSDAISRARKDLADLDDLDI